MFFTFQLQANTTGIIYYTLIIFASNPHVIIRADERESDANRVIDELRKVETNRSKPTTCNNNKLLEPKVQRHQIYI